MPPERDDAPARTYFGGWAVLVEVLLAPFFGVLGVTNRGGDQRRAVKRGIMNDG